MIVHGRAALCTSAKEPSAKLIWHSCTERRSAARASKERHYPAQPGPSPESPELSKAARQAT
jgi:hypothetical protein